MIPFVIIVLIVLAAALLVPWLSRRRQQRRQEDELSALAVRLRDDVLAGKSDEAELRKKYAELGLTKSHVDSLMLYVDNMATKHYREGNRAIARADHVGAIASYGWAIRFRSTFQTAYANRAAAKIALSDLDGALQDIERALALSPQDASAISNRGLIKARQGRFEDARDDYSKAIELAPEEPANYANRADVDLEIGDFQKAIDDATKALELSEKPGRMQPSIRAVALETRGMARRKMGDVDGGDGDLRTAAHYKKFPE